MADSFDWSTLLGALASGGASLYSSSQLSDAQKKALQSQLAAASTASSQLAPYQAIGTSAANALSSGDYTNTNLYKTGLSESEKAINRALASRGQYGSGGAVNALSENAQNYNTNYTNTLGNLANIGVNATNAINSINQSAANANAASTLGQTQSKLNGYTGLANSLASLLGSSTGQSLVSGAGSALGSLGSALGSGASSLLDWYNSLGNSSDYGKTLSGENVTDWYDKNFGSQADTMPDYYSQGEDATNWVWDDNNGYWVQG